MSDLVASSRQPTDAQPATAAEARARLALLDDALLVLLAKRLARAMLLDSNNPIEPDPLSGASGQADFSPADSHS